MGTRVEMMERGLRDTIWRDCDLGLTLHIHMKTERANYNQMLLCSRQGFEHEAYYCIAQDTPSHMMLLW